MLSKASATRHRLFQWFRQFLAFWNNVLNDFSRLFILVVGLYTGHALLAIGYIIFSNLLAARSEMMSNFMEFVVFVTIVLWIAVDEGILQFQMPLLPPLPF